MSDWKNAWQPMIEAIGKNFSEGQDQWGADAVELGAIRRFLEPLEFDCQLHYDQSVAKEFRYSDVIAPYSSLLTWLIEPYWKPDMHVFNTAERNAPAVESPLLQIETAVAPKTPCYFATDIEVDYVKPILVGDRLCRVGDVLLSCTPKETKVGRGAFMVWETKVQNQKEELVAVVRISTYHYFPVE
ncbi:MaoC family dehydratase N-terminal domain-containing protein [Bacillus sp. 1P10SD]|uniref:FAS1-like dehydratase domain-containing protein n=1 Tax=Bacillus sp. 1P10SD TaxID=3132265 RepID=UPI0039A57062